MKNNILNEMQKITEGEYFNNCTASEFCKKSGLSSLADVSRLTEQSPQTLNNWHKKKPYLFAIVVAGCVKLKELQRVK